VKPPPPGEVKLESGTRMTRPPLPGAGSKRRRSNSNNSSSGGQEDQRILPIPIAVTGDQGSFTPIVKGGIAVGMKRGRERERDTTHTRARITFRSASPNSINIASALSLLSGVRSSPIVMDKERGVSSELVSSSESEMNSGSPSNDSFARKDSIDDSTTSSDTCTTQEGVAVEVHGGEKAPWLEIVGVAVSK
jgi:hypothetical protein